MNAEPFRPARARYRLVLHPDVWPERAIAVVETERAELRRAKPSSRPAPSSGYRIEAKSRGRCIPPASTGTPRLLSSSRSFGTGREQVGWESGSGAVDLGVGGEMASGKCRVIWQEPAIVQSLPAFRIMRAAGGLRERKWETHRPSCPAVDPFAATPPGLTTADSGRRQRSPVPYSFFDTRPPSIIGLPRRSRGRRAAADVARRPRPVRSYAVCIAAVASLAKATCARHRQLARTRGGLREVADASFGSVDPDQPDPFRLAARQPDVQRVSVDDVRHRAAVGERSGGHSQGSVHFPRRHTSAQPERAAERGKLYACCGRLAPFSEKEKSPARHAPRLSRRTWPTGAQPRRRRPRSQPSPRSRRPRSSACAR